jgi:cytochrome P450
MQSHYLLHTDPTIFPEPYTFEPQRWIDNPSLRANYFLGFGRGTRVCLGINLANAELYLTVAYICARFDMELFETERGRDVDVVMDSVIGQPSLESKGIRVKITRDSLKDEQA